MTRIICVRHTTIMPMRKLTVEELERPDLATFRQMKKTPLVVVLDNVRSLHNVGSVLRSADAFALEAVYMCGITPSLRRDSQDGTWG